MSDRILIWDLPRTEEDAVYFLQSKGLLPVTRQCQNGHEMRLYFTEDKPFWQCNIRQCRKKLGIRTDTWFVRSRLPFVTILRFIYCWCNELNSLKWCEEQLGMCSETTVDWNNYMREVCAFAVESRNEGKIGGEARIVEIDLSLFSRRKCNTGEVVPEQWILGGLCRETGGRFLVAVPNRSAETLFEHIIKFVEPGSTIISDCWKGYDAEQLQKAGFPQLGVDHKYNFIDPEKGAHIHNVDRMWGFAKWRSKRPARQYLDTYLAEFIWRKTITEDSFIQLLDDIVLFWANSNL